MSAVNIAEEMNVALPERADAPTAHATHPFLWSIRHEIWESPSIIVAPIAVAGFIILATLFTAVRHTGDILSGLARDGAPPSTIVGASLMVAPMILCITLVGAAIFYSLDALHSERTDRSILFWKSLPVSDTTTVFSKMAVPMLLLPIVTFVVTIAADIAIFLIESIALLTHQVPLSSAWGGIPVFSLFGSTAYLLIVVTLWYAPIYAWFLLVSAWARRTPLLWAVIPFFLLSVFERIAFHTRYVHAFIHDRFFGVFQVAFSRYNAHIDTEFRVQNYNLGATPGHFLASPALWLGLLFTALALILIIRLRRSSGPI